MEQVDFKKLRILIDEAITYNHLEKARQLAERGLEAAELTEKISERMYFSAQIAIIDENFIEAIKLLDLAIKYNPNDGAAFNDRALCMVEMGQLTGVLDYFNKGIDVEPDFATIHHNKGWFLNQMGEHKQALDCFNEALKLEPGRVVTYENMADCLFKQGFVTEAIEAYEKAVMFLGEENDEIKKQLKRLIKILQAIRSKKE